MRVYLELVSFTIVVLLEAVPRVVGILGLFVVNSFDVELRFRACLHKCLDFFVERLVILIFEIVLYEDCDHEVLRLVSMSYKTLHRVEQL